MTKSNLEKGFELSILDYSPWQQGSHSRSKKAVTVSQEPKRAETTSTLFMFSPPTQVSSQPQGKELSGWVSPQLTKLQKMWTGQSHLSNPSLGLPSPVTLDCIKLKNKIYHHIICDRFF